MPLTVYGSGGQIRGYLNLRDTMQCIQLAVDSPPPRGELRILNQFTETFSVNELADRVRHASGRVGLKVQVEAIPNPRKEAEDHYYNPAHSGLTELGLTPTLMSEDILVGMIREVMRHKEHIDRARIMPRVRWR